MIQPRLMQIFLAVFLEQDQIAEFAGIYLIAFPLNALLRCVAAVVCFISRSWCLFHLSQITFDYISISLNHKAAGTLAVSTRLLDLPDVSLINSLPRRTFK